MTAEATIVIPTRRRPRHAAAVIRMLKNGLDYPIIIAERDRVEQELDVYEFE